MNLIKIHGQLSNREKLMKLTSLSKINKDNPDKSKKIKPHVIKKSTFNISS